ncbi:MAG: heme lyase CcmF/NrfE family subunit [Acidobacteriota bacterium]|jgi:cytochrome c-type biogenesis protein CcmF|nr:heme lyase CcmF/NrfE family subunit [Acidobacteriota bacterium]
MASFGNFCLLLSLCLSVFGFLAAVFAAWQRQDRILRSAERAVYAAAGSVTLAFLSLLGLLLTNDFSTSHVAESSSRDLAIFYKIAAIWGAHDGSMVLWVFFTAILSAIVAWQNRSRYRGMMPYVLAILAFNLSFFLFLNFFFSNPFDQLVQVFADGSAQPFVPADGRGLNPLLHHWAMVIHPPILYLGFIGFVVPFAFAFAALATKQLGDTWIRTTRRWTLFTWLMLGVGILLGGKWAYVVLGWGGYWGWDPVENSSLMPWLASTAFLHSIIVQERRGMLKVWNIFLVLLSFLLGIFGTFITRSGIVSSVHAFADSNLGMFLLAYMILALVGTLYLIADRRPFLQSERRLDSVMSRESAFLFNNFILIVSCFAVFWGTMFPAISEWIRGTKISVGPPFFNKVNIPIGLILLFLTGVGPLFAWRRTSSASLKKSLAWPAVFFVITGAGLLAAGVRNFYALVCLALCAFVIATIVEEFYKGARVRMKTRGENLLAAAANLTWKNKRRYGGYIIHLSIALMFLGFAGNAFNRETTERVATGQEINVGGYTLKMTGYQEGETPTYQYGRAIVEAYRNGRLVRTLKPERRIFKGENPQATTIVALHSTPKEDLYVVFAGMTEDSKAEIAAHVNPLVFWIWFGAAVMVLGSIITLMPDKAVGSR